MSVQRMINSKFWSDNFIVDLNPLDRYLFLYFLTNEHTNICGIYELPIIVLSRETGIEKTMLYEMVKRLEGKVYYIDGWVYLKNFVKHQSTNESIRVGIQRAYATVPKAIMEKVKEIDGDIEEGQVFFRKEVRASVKKRILKRDEYKCSNCGATGDDVVLEVDHIIPASKGGNNEEENLQTLCRGCNLKKSDTVSEGVRGSDISNINKIKLKQNKKQKLLLGEYEDSFNSFWKEYPEKVGKGKAYEVWQLLTEETKQLCITAIKKQVENKHFYKEWKKEDIPPHPTTWLNQKRWEDEVKGKKVAEVVKLTSK